MINCRNINLRFGKQIIFKNMNFRIHKGENVCVVSESGLGKSSLLKLLQGFIIPQSGDVFINDILLDKTTINQIRKLIVWVPQNINFPVDSGEELISMMQLSDSIDLIYRILNDLQLDKSILYKKFTDISGGQKQRIIISICLSIDRPIILLDEPTSFLDSSISQKLFKIIDSLDNKTILSASHDDNWTSRVNRIVDLGKISK